MKIKMVFALSLASFLAACFKKEHSGEAFTLSKTDYTGSELRTDGCYLWEVPNEEFSAVYALYRNGVVFNPGVTYDLEADIAKWNSVDHLAAQRQMWGLFEVDGSTIRIEYYKHSMSNELPAYLKTGHIVDDSTFVLTEIRPSHSTETETIHEIYHFRACDPKPDSTNNFF